MGCRFKDNILIFCNKKGAFMLLNDFGSLCIICCKNYRNQPNLKLIKAPIPEKSLLS